MLIDLTESEVRVLEFLLSDIKPVVIPNESERVAAYDSILEKLNPLSEESDGGDPSPRYPHEDMDGDFDSAMASAGHGTDEDYEHGTSGFED